jgi:hypothetical protein
MKKEQDQRMSMVEANEKEMEKQRAKMEEDKN